MFNQESGNFSGLVVVSDRHADILDEFMTFVGTDDGTTFWNVHGEWTNKEKGELKGYFSHRGEGFQDLTGVLSDSGLTWNGNASLPHGSLTWKPLSKPGFSLTKKKLSTAAEVGGFYVEPQVQKKCGGTHNFCGTRLVGANYFPNVSFVGTEDGEKFWTIIGRWTDKPGQFLADFTPIGGPNATGTVGNSDDVLLWSDGIYWQKEIMVKNGTGSSMIV